MKKIIIIVIAIFMIISCYDIEHKYELAYDNGDTEIIYTKSFPTFENGCFYGYPPGGGYITRCGVRKINRLYIKKYN